MVVIPYLMLQCGFLGHIASNCPQKGRRSRESEMPNQSENNSGSNRTMNNIVAEDKDCSKMKMH